MRSFSLLNLTGIAALAAAVGACVPVESDLSLVNVQPRVVVDGLIELTSQTDGDLFIDGIVLHAPVVEATEGEQRFDLLASDPVDKSALFFRYDLSDPNAGAVTNERQWALRGRSDDAVLVFSFSPLDASGDELDTYETEQTTELDELNGYTAVISGYVAMHEDAPASGHSIHASGDPDGMPAREKRGSGDPDGLPDDELSGDPDGMPASGDPDGLPDDEEFSGDPDGLPADNQFSGDPDGMPAQHVEQRATKSTRHSKTYLRPFVLILPSAMELSLPMHELNLGTLDDDSYLAIDLHLDLMSLINVDVVDDLREDDGEVASVVVRDVAGAFDLHARKPLASDDDSDRPTLRNRNITDPR